MDDYLADVKRIECANKEDGDGADMEVDGHEVEQQQYLNGKALYDVSSGAPRKHGRLAIANGAVKSLDVRAAGREISVRPSNSVTMQNMSREMEELRHANGRLQRENREKDNALQQNKVLVGLVLNLYQETRRVVPEEALRHLSATQAIATGSSHAASESANNANDVGHTNGDLHAANIDNNQGSDNNGDHASIM
ncbi:unnamed protein product [Miscanthus lutarioriparius]|uniref:Uncharacterized protein n=1 Tax=Miscanthus lutarioriparius TaxID=422564 RepID=A0A811R5S4_9POAL|nr:unnamed protein product [Miscanthus lutarioriparius]